MTLQVIRSGVVVQSVALAQHTATMHVGSAARAAADGVASLDGSGYLPILQMRPCIEDYSNHLGAADNFIEIVTTGAGSVTPDATNHEFDIDSTTSAVSTAVVQSKKLWTLGAKPIVANFIVANHVTGSGGNKFSYFGFRNDFTAADIEKFAGFQVTGIGQLWGFTKETGDYQYSNCGSITGVELLTVIATSSKVYLFADGVLKATHTTHIPTSALHVGAAARADSNTITVARSFSLCMIGMRRYA